MGADGYIAIYDWEKVHAHLVEQGRAIDWPGYVCDWTCNGRPACLVYWETDTRRDWHPFDDWPVSLRDWCNENALLVRQQRVWT